MHHQLNELDLHLTNRCQFQCQVCCFTSNENVLGELPLPVIRRLLQEALSLGCCHVHLTGGEPLLRKDFDQILQGALNMGFTVRLQTNGAMLTLDRARRLKEIGLQSIMISLDSADREINDGQRGSGSYENAIQAIHSALIAGFEVRVNAVLTDQTIDVFPNLVKMLISMGVSKISAFYFSPIGRGRRHSEIWVTPVNFISRLNKISPQLEQLKGEIKSRPFDLVLERGYTDWSSARFIDTASFTGCGAGCGKVIENRDYVIIRSDGEAYPCILTIDWEKGLGNVHEKSLTEIIRDDDAWCMLDRSHLVSQCGDCEHWNVCRGGCAGYAEIMSGNSRAKDPRCATGKIVPLCPIMKYNYMNSKFGGSSEDVMIS